MTKDNGGNAFPALYHDDTPGMTLRDWFAGQALVGMVTSDRKSKEGEDGNSARSRLATASYRMADAMLEARK